MEKEVPQQILDMTNPPVFLGTFYGVDLNLSTDPRILYSALHHAQEAIKRLEAEKKLDAPRPKTFHDKLMEIITA